MVKRAITPVPKTFDELVRAVRHSLIAGQSRVDRAYLETYRNTGLLIEAHLHHTRYGEGVVARLAGKLGIDTRLLYRCLRFVREYPIVAGRPQLTWSHYRLLIDVSDPKQREVLETATHQNNWTGPELERHVRAWNAIDVAPSPAKDADGRSPVHKPLVPKRGTPGVYRVAKVDGALVVDLGFSSYFDLNEEQAKTVTEGDLVRLSSAGQVTPATGATKADLFTYHVEVGRVVDGDTLWIKIYLRPRQWIRQKLRLRGLDCPELGTPAGKAAKRFVDGLVAKTRSIVIHTTKPDKYDRYLADVFLALSAEMPELAAAGPGATSATPGEDGLVFLNNLLLENGHAARKDAWEFGDWEPDLLK